MKAKLLVGETSGGKRIPLKELLPLSAPLVIEIFPIYSCNFKCKYCIMSVDNSKRGFISDKPILDYQLAQKVICELSQFPKPLKTLRFSGMGEPTLYKRLPDMIALASEKRVCERTQLLSNGTFLTPKLSDSLISAGLTNLLISAQGVTAAKYQEVTGVPVDFQKLLDNIIYFYEHRKQCKIHIKIPDCALNGKADEDKFFELFGDICDTIALEYTIPIFAEVEYSKVLLEKKLDKTQFGMTPVKMDICPHPFFSMKMLPDGKISPCCASMDYPAIIGNCNNETIVDIWNGPKMANFRRKMLNGASQVNRACRECNALFYRSFSTDNLDDQKDKLKSIYLK